VIVLCILSVVVMKVRGLLLRCQGQVGAHLWLAKHMGLRCLPSPLASPPVSPYALHPHDFCMSKFEGRNEEAENKPKSTIPFFFITFPPPPLPSLPPLPLLTSPFLLLQ